MVRYDKIFSIIDIKEENMKKWGKCFHFIRMYRRLRNATDRINTAFFVTKLK